MKRQLKVVGGFVVYVANTIPCRVQVKLITHKLGLSESNERVGLVTQAARGQWIFGVVFFVMWSAFALIKVYPGTVHFDLSELYMWSTLGFKLGYVKHPPLLTWIVGAIGYVVPLNWVTLTLLGVVNISIGAFAVFHVAKLTLGERRAMLAVALFCLSPYATWHAVKLDHSSALVSLWPLTVWAFLLALREPTAKRGIILGLASALAMYGKYSSALLLFALFIAALANPRRAQIFKSPAPYVATGVLLVLFAPHLWWVASDSWSTVKFASKAVVPTKALPLGMLSSNLMRSLPVLAAFALLWQFVKTNRADLNTKPENSIYQREIIIILAITYSLTIIITAVMGLRASANWSMPIFALLPVFLAGLLREPSDEQLQQIRRFLIGLMSALPFIAAAILAIGFKQNNRNIVQPQNEIAREAAGLWSRTFHEPVGVVAGSIRYSAAASLELPEHPRAWVQFDDYWWITPEIIAKRGVLGFCADDDMDCRKRAGDIVTARNGWSCTVTRRRTLWTMQGRPSTAEIYIVPPQSFAGPMPAPEARCPPQT